MSKDAIIEELYGLQSGRCAGGCGSGGRGRRLATTGFQVDHIVPTIRGGADVRANKQLTCPRCNREKGGLEPHVYYRRKGFLL